MTDRIVDQDHGQLMEAIRIAQDLDGPRRLELEIVGGGECFRGMDRLRGDLFQSNGFQANKGPIGTLTAGIWSGREEQVVQQPPHAVTFTTNVVESSAQVVSIDHKALSPRLPHEHVDIAANRGQWGAQLMGSVGDESFLSPK